jgi:hypothetical protein
MVRDLKEEQRRISELAKWTDRPGKKGELTAMDTKYLVVNDYR